MPRRALVCRIRHVFSESCGQQTFVAANFGLHGCTLRQGPTGLLAFETSRGPGTASYDPDGRTAAGSGPPPLIAQPRYMPGIGRHSMISIASPGKIVKCG
jgi:hypothetical protein